VVKTALWGVTAIGDYRICSKDRAKRSGFLILFDINALVKNDIIAIDNYVSLCLFYDGDKTNIRY